MHNKVLPIIIVLGLITMALLAEAVPFEGPTIESPNAQTNVPETKPIQSANPQNTTTFDQTPSTSPSALNIEVASDVYSDKDRQVLCCPNDNYTVVRNRIYLVGSDLDKVKEVTYFLHETFDRPEGVMGEPENNFEIWIWSWGGFLINAVITTKSGQVFEKDFDFTFKSKFEEAQNKGIPQILRCYE